MCVKRLVLEFIAFCSNIHDLSLVVFHKLIGIADIKFQVIIVAPYEEVLYVST